MNQRLNVVALLVFGTAFAQAQPPDNGESLLWGRIFEDVFRLSTADELTQKAASLSKSTDWQTRSDAAFLVGYSADDRNFERQAWIICGLLMDVNPEVRASALEAAWNLRKNRARFKPFVEPLLQDADPEVKQWAERVMAAILEHKGH